MAKITELPAIPPETVDGSELVPVVKDGEMGKASLAQLLGAAIADYRRARGAALASAVASAAGDGAADGSGAIKLLVTADGAKAWQADDPLTLRVEELTPLIGPAGKVLGQTGALFDGSGPAPAPPALPEWTEHGIRLHKQSGFVFDDGLISQATARWAIDLVVRFPEVAAEYASVAAMTAAVDEHPVGTLVRVTGGQTAEAGVPEDPPEDCLLGYFIDGGGLRRGYYLHGNAAWNPAFVQLVALYDSASYGSFGNGSDHIWFGMDALGRVGFYGYDGTIQAGYEGFYVDAIASAAGGPAHFRLENDGTHWIALHNGAEVAAVKAQPSFVPDSLQVNGYGTSTFLGAQAIPRYRSGSFTFAALCVSEGLDYTAKRAVTDVIADAAGTPRTLWSETADLVLVIGQSEFAGGNNSTAGDPARPDPDSNWNGELTPRSNTDARLYNPSQERLPGVYCSNGLLASDNIGPLASPHFLLTSSGNPVPGGVRYTLNGAKESCEWGVAKQLRLAEASRANHLYFVGCLIGGASQAQLEAQSGRYLHGLKNGTINPPYYRDLTNRAVLEVRDRCHARGQKLRLIGVLNAQAKTSPGGGADDVATAREADFRSWWDELKVLVDIATPPVFSSIAWSYSSSGTGNDHNTGAFLYRDDQWRRIAENRDPVFRYRPLCSNYAWAGRWTHIPVVTQRKLGEAWGRVLRRAIYEGKDDEPPQVVSATIGSGEAAGYALLTLNREVEVVAEELPNVLGPLQSGDDQVRGIVFTPHASSPGRTIDGDVVLGTPTIIAVPISDGGPIAGDRISVTGAGARWSNFKSTTPVTGEYEDQEWPASIPFADEAPELAFGDLNDLTEWLAPSTHVLI